MLSLEYIGKIEAGLMCEVYGYCTVAIAASSALNGNGGCLFKRNTEHRWVGFIEIAQEQKLTKYALFNGGIRRMCVEDAPLSDRAVRMLIFLHYPVGTLAAYGIFQNSHCR